MDDVKQSEKRCVKVGEKRCLKAAMTVCKKLKASEQLKISEHEKFTLELYLMPNYNTLGQTFIDRKGRNDYTT